MGNDSFLQYNIKSRQQVDRQGDPPVIPTFNDLPSEIYKLRQEVQELTALLLNIIRPQPPPQDRRLTIMETAHLLGLKSRNSVYSLTFSGEIDSFKIKKRRYFMESEVIRYIDKLKQTSNLKRPD